MSHDKKTGAITTNGDKEQFEKDLFAHFAHVQEQVNSELSQRAKKKSLRQRLSSLSRSTKLSMVGFMAWSFFVWFRTADYYELLGFHLDQWDENYFLLNWLILPAFLIAIIKATGWALKNK